MIDWLTIEVDLPHRRILGGSVLFLDKDGIEERCIDKFAPVIQPSWDTAVQVRTVASDWVGTTYRPDGSPDFWGTEVGYRIWISGCPLKLLQGHNLWGTDDLQALACAFVRQVFELMGQDCHLTPFTPIFIKRVDLTQMFSVGSREGVRAWLYSAQAVVRSRKGGGLHAYGGETLEMGQQSTRVKTKFYGKGDEMDAKGHGLAEKIVDPWRAALYAYADPMLRVEVTILAKELKRLGLEFATTWTANRARLLFRERLRLVNIPENAVISKGELEGLSVRMQGIYAMWRSGVDLKKMFKKPTFYRHRKELLNYGVDIASAPRDLEVSNTVPLINYVTAEPASVPAWAFGTPYYFEVKRRRSL